MKKTIVRIICHLLVITWMILIFSLSAQDNHRSSSLSGEVVRKVAQVLVPNFDQMADTQQKQLIDSWQHNVRKMAHFFLYVILGLLVMGAMYTYQINIKWKITVAFAVSLLFAISDEIHQSLVPGRGPLASDVVIDGFGALAGIAVLIGAKLILWRLKGSNEIIPEEK